MKTRKLGWTELELTTIGLGTWAIGGGNWAFAWGPQDDRESTDAIERAIEGGINWVDTAPAYGLGHAEEVLGRTLKHLSRRPIVATKCGRSWDHQRNLFPSLRKEVIRAEVEASLKRLQIEVIDLYQVHWPQPEEELEEGWSAISDMVRQGKIRFAGVCNFSVDQLKRIQPIHPVASLQPPYSMLEREVEKELLPFCNDHQIGVVAYSPLQKGLLTGKVTRDWIDSLPEDDHRRRDPRFQEPMLSANLRLVDQLRPIADRADCTLSELAIGWVLRREELTSAIVGVRRADQAEALLRRADPSLPDEIVAEIDRLLDTAAG